MKNLLSLMLALSIFGSCQRNEKGTEMEDGEHLNVDALQASPDNFRLLFENEHVRVLEYTLKPGTMDQPHTHPPKSSYVVTGGKVKVYLDNGDSKIFDEQAGSVSWMDNVGKHYVENMDTSTIKIILTEVKALVKK